MTVVLPETEQLPSSTHDEYAPTTRDKPPPYMFADLRVRSAADKNKEHLAIVLLKME